MDSLHANLLFYVAVGGVGIFGIVLLLLAGKLPWQSLGGLSIAMSNTFGLLAVTVLLAYGLVEVPRYVWHKANTPRRFRYVTYLAGRVNEKLEDAHAELSTVIMVVKSTSNQMPRRSHLRPLMDLIEELAYKDTSFKPSTSVKLNDDDLDYDSDEKSLASLRRRLMKAINHYSRVQTQFRSVLTEALALEDVLACAHKPDRRFRSSFATGANRSVFREQVEWWWKCFFYRPVLGLVALLLGLLSISIVVAEAAISTHGKPDLSVFSYLMRNWISPDNETGMKLLVGVPLAYVCVCSYYSLFRLGAFSFYYLVPGHTDSLSLLINAALMCRFAAPVCYNFLMTIHADVKSGSHTVFSQCMGAMDDIPFLGQKFNTFFPIALVVYCFCILMHVFNRIFNGIGSIFSATKRYRFDEDSDDDDQYSEMGRAIIRRERESLSQGRALGDLAGSRVADIEARGAFKPPVPTPSTSLLAQNNASSRLGGPNSSPAVVDKQARLLNTKLRVQNRLGKGMDPAAAAVDSPPASGTRAGNNGATPTWAAGSSELSSLVGAPTEPDSLDNIFRTLKPGHTRLKTSDADDDAKFSLLSPTI
eukprot:jgi/Mesvir1/1426/Mv14422-RA.3